MQRLLIGVVVYFALMWALWAAWPPRHPLPAWGIALVAAGGYCVGWWGARR